MEVLLDVLPLHLKAEELAMNAAWRLTKLGVWGSSSTGHSSIQGKLMARVPEASFKTEMLGDRFRFERKFKVELPSRKEWTDGTVK